MQLEKGSFYNADTGSQVVTCHFNPNELKISLTNRWQPPSQQGANPRELLHFGGSDPLQLTMNLTFDTYAEKKDVRDDTNKLLSLMSAPAPTRPGDQPRPPHVYFRWGTFSSFRAVITQASQTFTLFLPTGTPVRAQVQITLQEVERESVKASLQGQNPTSRAAGARRVHVVEAGDTIDWIATEELGDPAAWRLLAAANDLDDPRRLRPGQVLFIPPEP